MTLVQQIDGKTCRDGGAVARRDDTGSAISVYIYFISFKFNYISYPIDKIDYFDLFILK